MLDLAAMFKWREPICKFDYMYVYVVNVVIVKVIDYHPAKLFYHLVAIYIVCYEMGASAHLFNTYQYLHIWTVVGNALFH